MAGPIYADRVKDTSSTTGTGTLTLDNAPPTGSQSFAAVGNGNTCYYMASTSDQAQVEVGLGTYSSTGPTLARTTVAYSTNSNNKVNFSAPLTVELVAAAAFFSAVQAASAVLVGDTGSGGTAGIVPAPSAGDAAAGTFLKSSGAWATPNLGDAIQVGTRASVATTTIPAAINAIRTSGYAAAGDGGDALYKRVVSEPSHAGKVQSADGAWWEYVAENSVNVLAFGADKTGVSDTTTALSNAIACAGAAVPPKRVTVPAGVYLFTALTIPSGMFVHGHGGVNPLSSLGIGSILLKSASATSTGLTLQAESTLRDICVIGQAGNTGNGVAVIGGRVTLDSVSINKMGGIGLAIGNATTGTNTNLWQISRIITRNNGSHGVYITAPAASVDANGGTLTGLDTALNGGDGLNNDRAWLNTFTGIVAQSNTGIGLNFTSLSRWCTVVGGDIHEDNAGGDFYNDGFDNVFINIDPTHLASGDVGDNTTAFSRFMLCMDALVKGTLTARGDSATVSFPAELENRGNSNNGRGVGLKLKTPNGGITSRDGAIIKAAQETTGMDCLTFGANKSGVMTDYVRVSTATDAFIPVTDSAISLGTTAAKWSTLHAINAKLTPVTVANLPAAATIGAGAKAFVSDANATTFASVVAGSGSNNIPVYSDGTDWRIG